MVELPGIYNKITSARLLQTGEKLSVNKPAEGLLRISVPKEAPDNYASVIELIYEGELKAERVKQAEKE